MLSYARKNTLLFCGSSKKKKVIFALPNNGSEDEIELSAKKQSEMLARGN